VGVECSAQRLSHFNIVAKIKRSRAMGCESSKEAGSCCCGGEKDTTGKEAARQTKSPAMEILEERFARGEIDKTEFEDRRQVLASAK